MKLLLLPLVGMILGGEALDTFQESHPPLTRIFALPYTRFHERVRAAQQAMLMKMNTQGTGRIYFVNLRPTRLAPSRDTVMVPLQSHSKDSDRSGLGQTRRPEVSQDFVPSNFGNHQSPPAVNQGNKPTSLGQAPKTPSMNHKPSSFGEVHNPSAFNQDPKPSVSGQQHKPSSFDQDSQTPSFNPSHESSSSHEEQNPSAFNEDFKPSGFEDRNKPSILGDGNKPSTSSKDHRPSTFGQDQKPFNQDRKPSLFDKHGSHPDRNPICNLRPDSGTCRAALPRYYFDPETGTCNCFLYGGCREDGQKESPGSFFTLEECHRECRPPRLEEGPICKNIFKEDQFISYLVEPQSQNTQTDHLSDTELLASF